MAKTSWSIGGPLVEMNQRIGSASTGGVVAAVILCDCAPPPENLTGSGFARGRRFAG